MKALRPRSPGASAPDERAAASAAAADGLTLSSLAKALWAKKRWIFLPLAVVVAMAYLAVNLVSPRYTSEASILIEDNQSVFARAEGEGRGDSLPDPQTVASHVQLLLSRDLAANVVRELGLTELAEFDYLKDGLSLPKRILVAIGIARDPRLLTAEERAIKSYYDKISVFKVSESRVVAVQFTSKNPELAAKIANAVADQYIALQLEARRQSTMRAAEWLGDQVSDLRAKVEQAEARVEEYRSSNGLLRGSGESSLTSQQLSELNSQLIVAQTRRAEAHARADTIRQSMRAGGNLSSNSEVLNSQLIQRLMEQQVILKRRIAELRPTLLPQHPRMRELMAELSDLKQQIRTEAEKIVRGLESEARIAGARENAVLASLNMLKEEATKASAHEVELRALEREARAQRELLESFLTRFREASARDNKQASPALARIISRATVSNDPSWPSKGGILAIAVIATLMASIGTISALEIMNSMQAAPSQPGRISPSPGDGAPAPSGGPGGGREGSEPEVADLPLGPAVVPVHQIRPIAQPDIAASAAQPAKPAPVASLDFGHHPQVLRDLAEKVLALKSDEGCLRVLVSSPQRLARDNFAAVNLARLLHISGHQTILIDGNLRAPRLAAQLGLGDGVGFSDLLAGHTSFADVIQRDPASRIHVITSGQVKADTGALMSKERVERLLDALEGNYGFIVIDLPPVMLSPEPRVLAAHADLAVLVEDNLPGAQRLASRASDMLRDQARIPIDVLQVAPEAGAEIKAEAVHGDLRIA